MRAARQRSAEEQFDSAPSASKGYVRVSDRDPRFFETSDGTPFVTPLINVEQGSPFNTLASIRETIPLMGDGGIRFLRWFPTGEGANVSLASFADTIRINWVFGDGWTTSEGADIAAGKLYSYAPYYYSSQTLPVIPNTTYRLTFRAQVEGDRVLRPQLGSLLGGTLDICSPAGTYHQAHGGTCTVRADGWQDYVLQVQTGPTDTSLNVGCGVSMSRQMPRHPTTALRAGVSWFTRLSFSATRAAMATGARIYCCAQTPTATSTSMRGRRHCSMRSSPLGTARRLP